jgi:methyl halide transferase
VDSARPAVSTPEFWQDLYTAGRDGWELGAPAPALEAWLEEGGTFPASAKASPARVAVPGAGRGHDARLLAARGYRVWGFDWAPAAIEEARGLAAADGVDLTFEARDVFTLAETHGGFFDGVWEYTCFCAIDPARRAEYLRVLRTILRPGGLLLACFYPLREGTDGPPFPVSRQEIEHVLTSGFVIRSAHAPARSAERRQDLEWLVLAERT